MLGRPDICLIVGQGTTVLELGEAGVDWILFVAPASGMARYRDPAFLPFVRLSVNICDHATSDPSVRVSKS